ncbi:MAG: class I SAM-dependent methyltransferase [Spirochaetes bacterium]|nr:class I SAM-dependent methyltransferase [Spirochaetota bacterium]MBN2769322.1 class I SAM-dependent methyltransferase [Spirochaetota bacterium]HRX15191.1 class I SAM-dependent methyltransferase [Spirochaetota bacterium]
MKLYSDLAEHYFYIENKHRNISNDVGLIKQLLPRNSRSRILDLGCGTGEHLALLSKEGFLCHGIDNSSEMIENAKKRNGVNISYEIGSMNNFDYFNRFDMVICLFGSFNYMLTNKDIDAVMCNTYRSLKPGGLAMFEIWNAYPLHKIEHKPLSHVSTTYAHDNKIVRERGFTLTEKQPRTIVDVFYNYHVFSMGKVKRLEDRHTMRAYYQKEIEKFVKDAGFKIIDRFANSMKERFHQFSNKMILVMEKPF